MQEQENAGDVADVDRTILTPSKPRVDAEPDLSDTVVGSHVSHSPYRLIEPPEPTDAPARYGSHGAWPATEGSLLGRRSTVAAESTAAPIAQRYYGFRVGNSEVVLLDAIVYLGRKPSAPRVVRGGLPRLVRVPSSSGEVSSTHLELRQVGRTVVVTDMRSTNGTLVSVPGLDVRRLRQGESLVVTPGTLIDVGDRVVIEILPLQVRQ